MGSKFIYAMLLATIVFSAIGCTGTAPPQGATPTATYPTTTPTAAGTPQPGSAQAVDFNELIKFLPKAPAGYAVGTPPSGGRYTTSDGSYSSASVTYTKKAGESEIEATITIIDSAYYNVGMFTAWKSFISYETTDGYYKSDTVSGYPAWKFWQKSDNEYGLYIALNDRFMVYINTFEESTLNEIKNSINYNGIAALR